MSLLHIAIAIRDWHHLNQHHLAAAADWHEILSSIFSLSHKNSSPYYSTYADTITTPLLTTNVD